MKRRLGFEKDPDGSWYAILPEWEGDRAELQMVAGADVMCDILSQGENSISVQIGDESIENADKLDLVCVCKEVYGKPDFEYVPSSGAFYSVNELKGISYDYSIWLCDVTKLVFGNFPLTIYIK